MCSTSSANLHVFWIFQVRAPLLGWTSAKPDHNQANRVRIVAVKQ